LNFSSPLICLDRSDQKYTREQTNKEEEEQQQKNKIIPEIKSKTQKGEI